MLTFLSLLAVGRIQLSRTAELPAHTGERGRGLRAADCEALRPGARKDERCLEEPRHARLKRTRPAILTLKKGNVHAHPRAV